MFISSSLNHVDGSVSVDLSAALNFEQAGVSKRAGKAASAALSGDKSNEGGETVIFFSFWQANTLLVLCVPLCCLSVIRRGEAEGQLLRSREAGPSHGVAPGSRVGGQCLLNVCMNE